MQFGRRRKGATATEIGLLVGLIAVALIGVLTVTGVKLSDVFTGAKRCLAGETCDIADVPRPVAGEPDPGPFEIPATENAAPGAAVQSAAVTLPAFEGSVTLQVGSGASLLIGGSDVGRSATVAGGAVFQLRGTAPAAESAAVEVSVVAGSRTTAWRIATGDMTPEFTLAQSHAQFPGETVSVQVAPTGFTLPLALSVADDNPDAAAPPLLSLDGTAFSAGPLELPAGGSFWLRRTAPGASDGSALSATVTLGNAAPQAWRLLSPDAVPEDFAFPPVADAEPNASQTSATVTLAGMDAAAPATLEIVAGAGFTPLLSVDGGDFAAVPAMLPAGATLALQMPAGPLADGSERVVRLTVGGVAAEWHVATVDRTPDQFAFVDVDGAALGEVRAANATLQGFTGTVQASVTGTGNPQIRLGETGNWGADPLTVAAGDELWVSLTAGSGDAETRRATVSVNGVSDDFDVATGVASPAGIAFADRTVDRAGQWIASAPLQLAGMTLEATDIALSAGGDYPVRIGVNGATPAEAVPATIPRNASVVLALQSSGDPAAPVRTATLRIHGQSGNWALKTESARPDSFDFGETRGQPAATAVESQTVQLSGMTLPGALTVSAEGTAVAVAIDDVWQSGIPATVPANARLRLRLTTGPEENGQPQVVSVGVDGETGYWQVFTRDTQPDAFTVAALTDRPLASSVESDWIAISGIDAATQLTLAGDGGPQALVEGGDWYGTDRVQSLGDGQRFKLRLTSAAAESTAVTATVTVGGLSRFFRVTTGRVTPNDFAFAPATGRSPGETVSSAAVALSGMTLPAPFTLASSDGSAVALVAIPAAVNGVLQPNASVTLSMAAPGSADGATRTATLTVGSLSRSWSVSTVDTTPDAFGWGRLEGQPEGELIESEALTVSGLGAPAAVSVSGAGNPQVSVNGGAFTASPGTVGEGGTLAVRLTASSVALEERTATVTVGGVAGTFTLRTQGSDLDPDAITVAAKTEQQPGLQILSDPVTPTGFDRVIALAVSGADARLAIGNRTDWVTNATLLPGQSFRLRVTSAGFGASTGAHVTVGTRAADWTVATRAEDATPDAVTQAQLADLAKQPGNATLTATAFVPTGYTDPAPVSVSGSGNPQISIQGGAWTTSGTIQPGQSLAVRMFTGDPNGGSFQTALVLGKGAAAYTWTAGVVDTMPDLDWGPTIHNQAQSTWMSYAYDDGSSRYLTPTGYTDPAYYGCDAASQANSCHFHRIHDGLTYNASAGTILPGDTIIMHMWTAQGNNESRTCHCQIGGVWDDFTSVTASSDVTPQAFNFQPSYAASPGTAVESNIVTPVLYNDPASINFSGASYIEYRIDGGAWTSAAGSLRPGQSIQMRTVPSQAGTYTVSLGLGYMIATWSVSTAAMDNVPDPMLGGSYSWTNASPAWPSGTPTVTPSGYNAPAAVTMSDNVSLAGSFGYYYSTSGAFLLPGESFTAQLSPAATPRTTTTGWFAIGGQRVDLTLTTADLDDRPDPFTIRDLTGQLAGTLVSSEARIEGLSYQSVATVSGEGNPQLSLDGVNWYAAVAVQDKQTLQVRMTTGPADGSTRHATVTMGGVSDDWAVTTLDLTPTLSPAGFGTVTADPGGLASSVIVTVSGLGQAVPVGVSGAGSPQVSVNGTGLGGSGIVGNGGTLQVFATASASFGAVQPVTVTVGSSTATWQVATRAEDRVPSAFPIARKTNQPPSSRTASARVTPYNFEDDAPISVTGDGNPTISIDGGAEVTSGTVAKGQSFVVWVTSSPEAGGTARATVDIGGVTSTFEVVTRTATN